MMTSKNGFPNTSELHLKPYHAKKRVFSLSLVESDIVAMSSSANSARIYITPMQYFRYDIPVLHINDIYWTKHRLTAEDAISGIAEACAGNFVTQQGEPDASRFEHN